MLYSINLHYHLGALSDDDAVQIAREMNELIQSKFDSSLAFEIHRIEPDKTVKLEVYNLSGPDKERDRDLEQSDYDKWERNDKNPSCPNEDCDNPYPHQHVDGSRSCEECGNVW